MSSCCRPARDARNPPIGRQVARRAHHRGDRRDRRRSGEFHFDGAERCRDRRCRGEEAADSLQTLAVLALAVLALGLAPAVLAPAAPAQVVLARMRPARVAWNGWLWNGRLWHGTPRHERPGKRGRGGRGGSGSGAPGHASGGAGAQAARDGGGAGAPGLAVPRAAPPAPLCAWQPGAPASASGGAGDGARPALATIPAGTAFTVTFDAPLGSDTSRVEDRRHCHADRRRSPPAAHASCRPARCCADASSKPLPRRPPAAAGGSPSASTRSHRRAHDGRSTRPPRRSSRTVFTREDKRKVGIGAAAGAVLGGIVSRTKKAVGIGAAAGAGGTAAAVGIRNDLRLARGATRPSSILAAVPAPARAQRCLDLHPRPRRFRRYRHRRSVDQPASCRSRAAG